jgi:hypothetical protein
MNPIQFIINKFKKPKYYKFNLNSHIKVKLCDGARLYLAKNGHRIPPEDSEGWSDWQAWYLFAVLPPDQTALLPWDATIKIPSKSLKPE